MLKPNQTTSPNNQLGCIRSIVCCSILINNKILRDNTMDDKFINIPNEDDKINSSVD